MVISCCLVPSTAQIYDEEELARKKRRSKEKGDEVSWKRNKSKSESKKSKSKSSKSKSKSSKSSSKKKSKKEKVEKIKKAESREEEEEEEEEAEDEADLEVLEVPQKESRKPELKPKKDHKTKSSKSVSLEVEPEEPSRKKESRSVFRDPDAVSIKSDPLPASLPTRSSILNESFYSDDSLDDGTVTFEVDYTTSTPLFEALELNDWGNVLFFLRSGKFFSGSVTLNKHLDKPETQVRTWVHCRDERGELMWRQLPLHAAICLAAPLVVIQRLVEIYPDALACPDSFGNLPLNLAAKLHGTQSYIFQVVSLRSQRWLQTRQDSDDDLEESTVGTREVEREMAGVGPDPEEGFSFDRPQVPALFDRPLTPVNLPTIRSSSTAKKRGLEPPSGTPTRAFVERLRASYDETFSSEETVETVETEYKIYESKIRSRMGINDSRSVPEEFDVTDVTDIYY